MAEEKKVEEELLVPVGPGADEEVRDEADERRDEEVAEGGEVEEEEGAEERLGHEEQDDDREGIRQRRREEKKRRKENRNRDRLELRFLRERNETLERRQSELDARVANGEMVMIDNKISELDGQIREADRIKALAINKGDGDSAAQAEQIARDLTIGKNQLLSMKASRTQAARTNTGQPNADPMIQHMARQWAESHSWYDPNLRNADSKVAKAVEEQLALEGSDPRQPEYWQELDKRLKKYMPHRFGNGQRDTRDRDDDEGFDEEETEEREERQEPRRSRGPRITTGGRERPLRKNEVYVSAERKEALIQAGVWDDPKLRDKYLRRYQEYDREQRRR